MIFITTTFSLQVILYLLNSLLNRYAIKNHETEKDFDVADYYIKNDNLETSKQVLKYIVEKVKNEKILYLDVDNTICNSTKRFVEIYNQEYNQQADWTKCYKWDLSDICPLVKDSELYFAREDFYNDKLELIDNHVKGIIAILYLQGYDVHFITIGTKK